MVKYVKIENSLNLVIEVSDNSFDTGSWFYEVTTSEYLPNSIIPGGYQYSESVFVECTSSFDMSEINDIDFVKSLNDHDIIDYKKFRTWLKDYVVANNFYSLSLEDKKICAKNFVVERSERDTVYNNKDQIIFGDIYHNRSFKARRHRINRCISEIYNRVTESDAKQIMADLVHGVSGSDNNLVWKYESFGFEGTLEGDSDALFDYILARTESAFSGSGLYNRNYALLNTGDTIHSLGTDIINILQKGEYDWYR